jgi:hypothetical protein
VIYRINREFVKRAPEFIEFVDHPRQADFQIIQCVGAGSLTKIWNQRYVLFQHCLSSADIGCHSVWKGIFKEALMVASYIDLPSLLKFSACNFYMTPWGIDDSVFKLLEKPRSKALITTGWSLRHEAIEECYLAAKRLRLEMVNLGDDFHFGEGFSAVSRISDRELCNLYNECNFVSGLRFHEGFEIPVIEGLMCGCRPICFNLPIYTRWFGDLACYVHHCQGPRLADAIESILRQGPLPVSQGEISAVRDRFGWQNITAQFWQKILDYV